MDNEITMTIKGRLTFNKGRWYLRIGGAPVNILLDVDWEWERYWRTRHLRACLATIGCNGRKSKVYKVKLLQELKTAVR